MFNINKDDFILICPACGYSFSYFNPKQEYNIIKCPMCGYEIKQQSLGEYKKDNFNRKII